MKILHVVNELNNCGNGIVNLAVDLAASQQASGHQVAVPSPEGSLREFLAASGIRHCPITIRMGTRTLPTAYIRLRHIIKTFSPDIVHCHTFTGFLVAKVCHLTDAFSLISHVHNIHERRSWLMAFADHCIVVSEALSRVVQYWPVPKDRISVVTNCSLGSPRAAFFAGQTSCDIQLQQPAVVTVAGMNGRKNIDGLIDAFNQIAEGYGDAHLYLVGDGPDREIFERQASASMARKRIHFEGFQPNPIPYMRAARVFVLASHRDSFPLVLHEARQNGAAIVGTAVDGIPEALDHGEAGILVPPGDTGALANAMKVLLSDPAQLSSWRAAAQRNLSRHTVTAMKNKIDSIYEDVCGKPKGPTWPLRGQPIEQKSRKAETM